jgi:hypothetical protein
MASRLSQDIARLLDDWEFEPGPLQVRVIDGDDGREKIQMRIDLGVIQMELSGRPDGARPHGFESLLEYYEVQAQAATATGSRFALDPEDCAQLMREGLQYYRRYRSAFQLERYEIVAGDTARNLRLFTFVSLHAARERDKIEFERYRPYVQMMHTRSVASLSLQAGDQRLALETIDDGISEIRRFLRNYKQEERESQCDELRFLLRWRRDVERERPFDPLENLQQQLERSIAREDYAEAARLRDQIREVQKSDTPENSTPS